jgi:hypothetical protein
MELIQSIWPLARTTFSWRLPTVSGDDHQYTLQLDEFYMLCRGNKKYRDCKVHKWGLGP